LFEWALKHGFELYDEERDKHEGCFWDASWDAVIDTGSLEMVTWLDQLPVDLNNPDGFHLERAMQAGHMDICRYLYDAKKCRAIDTVWSAVLSDKPEMCEWLLAVEPHPGVDMFADYAANEGKLTVLRWAVEQVLS
jgi:hypothetical protein